jgi:hypothetical protein
MKTAFIVACLLVSCTSCALSTNPLSDPKEAKPDSRLLGMWQGKTILGEDRNYHVVPAGGKLPEGMLMLSGEFPDEFFMLADTSSHPSDKTEKEESILLGFTTTIKESTYLNLAAVKKDQFRELKDKGWQPSLIGGYAFCKCTVDKDVLTIRLINFATVGNAVRDGKIKGTLAKETDEPNTNVIANAIGDGLSEPVRVRVTDTSDNLRRVLGSDDAFFVKESEPLTMVLKRVNAATKSAE